MKKSIKPALLALLILGLAGVGLLSTISPGSATPTLATAAASSMPFGIDTFSPLRPFDWAAPINTTNGIGLYDDGPDTGGIAASQIDNSVTTVWGRADNLSHGLAMETSNSPLGSNFIARVVGTSCVACNGNVKAKHDALGRSHIVWWQSDGGTVCAHYALVEANDTISANEVVPNSCGFSRKNTALAVSPDGTVHAFFGRNTENNVYYYQRNPAGQWVVTNEQVTATVPVDLSAGVTINGVVMLAWKGASPGGNSDIYVAKRNSPSNWQTEDISYDCCLPACPTNSKAYLPALAGDPSGGMRISWSDENCNPRTPSAPNQDVYYREWVPGTGWDNQPIVLIRGGIGYSYQNSIAVDSSGVAHIVWVDTYDAPSGPFTVMYSKGHGTIFDAPTAPFRNWGGGAQEKDVGVDTSPGYAHVAFGSDRDDSQKENYYSYISVGSPLTPTPSPTVCPLGYFNDVHPTDYFYTAATYLAIRGIMSGYGDCTFRPYNNITRGQTAKIVVLGAELPINTTGGPHFSDVPTSNVFYQYVETAYNRGVIAGYPGGIYKPNDNVTRAQFSKMIVNAFSIPTNTTGGPHFRDVLTTNALYAFVETAFNNGLISGYDCGGAGEPCPGKYFRPNNSIFRGQAAKILFQAIPSPSNPTETSTPGTVATSTITPAPATNTPISAPTNTPIAATSTSTPVPSTATPTRTSTPIPSTATTTRTSTPLPATATATRTPTP